MAKSTLPRRSRGGATKHREPPTYDEKVQAITDFWKFIDIMDFQGGSQAFGEIHRELIDWSESHDSLKELILMPRGHLKSTLMTVAKTLHRIYQNPNIRIFVGTATKELAAAFVREIKTYLEDQWLQDHLWNDRPHYDGRLVPIMERAGNRRSRARKRKDMSLEEQIEFDLWEEETTNESEDKKTVWRGTAIQVLRPYILKEPTVVVGAVGVQPTGFHYDELKLDDVVNYDNVATPSKRDRVTAWIDDLIAVLDDPYIDVDYEQMLLELTGDAEVAEQLAIVGGRITACGTRYDREDWYASLLTRIEQGTTKYVLFAKNIYANGKDNEDGYLWHEKWNSTVEADKRAEMTAQKFASQYLNMIVVMEEQILAPDRIIRLLPYQVKLQSTGMVHITIADDDVREIYPILVIDPAAQVGAESDFTAIAVGGKDKQGRLYLIDGSVGKWKPVDTIKKMYEYADKWKLRRINVETVSGFVHFSEHIKSQFKVYRPLAINNFKPQGKKEVRIANALEPLFSNGMIYAMQYILLNEEIRDQFLFFPRKTIHDDFPDAVASLVELSKPPVAKPVRRVNKIINRNYGGVR